MLPCTIWFLLLSRCYQTVSYGTYKLFAYVPTNLCSLNLLGSCVAICATQCHFNITTLLIVSLRLIPTICFSIHAVSYECSEASVVTCTTQVLYNSGFQLYWYIIFGQDVAEFCERESNSVLSSLGMHFV